MRPETKKQLNLLTQEVIREFLEEKRDEILRRVEERIKELKSKQQPQAE